MEKNYKIYDDKNSKMTFNEKIEQVDENIREKWDTIQKELASKIKTCKLDKFRYVAGMDISFSKKDINLGIAGIVIIDVSDKFKIVYEDYVEAKLDQPYIPSYLAFREIDHYKTLLTKLKNHKYYPDVILLDGNGIIHPRSCGIAVHIGVEFSIPTIGCAKTFYSIDGITSDHVWKLSGNLTKSGQYIKLKGKSEKIYGAAVLTYTDYGFEEFIKDRDLYYYNYNLEESPYEPIIVSYGNMIDLDSSIDVVIKFNSVNINRVPLPIYYADKFTRKRIKDLDKKLK